MAHRTRSTQSRPSRGFTLFELGAVLATGLALCTGVLWAATDTQDRDRTAEAERAAQTLRGAAESWRRDNPNGCPTVSVLKHEAYLEPEARTDDPWGQRFQLRCGDDRVIVVSPGRDGKPNTADDIRVPHFAG